MVAQCRLVSASPTMAAVNEVQLTAAVNLGALLDAGEGAVVILVAGETRLAAHRTVLAARSPVFQAMFQHDTLEASSGHVTITDVEGPVMRELLAYMYTLQAPELPGMAPLLLAAADKYGLSALKAVCEQQVVAQLCVENAAASAVLAVRHSCPKLTAAAVAFIKANLHVMGTKGWADMMRNHLEHVIEFDEEPLGISCSTEFIKEDPEQNLEAGGTQNIGTKVSKNHRKKFDEAIVEHSSKQQASKRGRVLVVSPGQAAFKEVSTDRHESCGTEYSPLDSDSSQGDRHKHLERGHIQDGGGGGVRNLDRARQATVERSKGPAKGPAARP
ncbi:speckle-type POZ protein-like [Schistocerca americana]|uniref:speckle-type POZ protein-like n=1 Tax=Schistocerca americana TaxID=7009 RepID=UPI001F4F57D6|nr:speckle-type POZ protein-like [Schistocerca americana]